MKASTGAAMGDDAYTLALAVYRATQRCFRDGPNVLAGELRQTALRIATSLGDDGSEHHDEARGAAAKMEVLLIGARDLQYLSAEDVQRLRSGYREIAARLQLGSRHRAAWARQREPETDEE